METKQVVTDRNASDQVSDKITPHVEDRPVSEQLYPQGVGLFCLAGASIMGVFLISLDQVSSCTPLSFFCQCLGH